MDEDNNPANPPNTVKTGLVLTNLHLAMLVVILFLIATVAYLYGQTQKTQSAEAKQEPTPTQQTEYFLALKPTLSPTPTPQATAIPKQVVYYPPSSTPIPPSPIPTERKKVSVSVDDYGGLTKGNFYCYEDTVNHLADLQNQIRIYQVIADNCNATATYNAKSCSQIKCSGLDFNDPNWTKNYSDCIKPCYDDASATCNDKNNHVGDLRKQLYSDVHQDCP